MHGNPAGLLSLPACVLSLYPLCSRVLPFKHSLHPPLSPSEAHARPEVVILRVLSPVLQKPGREWVLKERPPCEERVQDAPCLTPHQRFPVRRGKDDVPELSDSVSEGPDNPLAGGRGHED